MARRPVMQCVSSFVLTLIKQPLRLGKRFKRVLLDNAVSRVQCTVQTFTESEDTRCCEYNFSS